MTIRLKRNHDHATAHNQIVAAEFPANARTGGERLGRRIRHGLAPCPFKRHQPAFGQLDCDGLAFFQRQPSHRVDRKIRD